jgi:hypothetical protein
MMTRITQATNNGANTYMSKWTENPASTLRAGSGNFDRTISGISA